MVKSHVSVLGRSLPSAERRRSGSTMLLHKSAGACLVYKLRTTPLAHLTHHMASSFPDPFVFGRLSGEQVDASPEFSTGESEVDFPLIPSLLDFLPGFDMFHAARPSFSAQINVPAVLNPGGLPDPGLISGCPARHFSLEDFGSHCLGQPESEFEVRVEALLPDLRQVLSAGDVQGSRCKNIIDGVEEMGLRVCRYSPEEKKERIERYLKKKKIRNFNKTIKYACRKTLADSRQRIRGRFARNDEFQDTMSRTTIEEIPHRDEVQNSELLSYYELIQGRRDVGINNRQSP